MEKFDPGKYKEYSDIPDDKKSEVRKVEGGFVTRSADEEYREAERRIGKGSAVPKEDVVAELHEQAALKQKREVSSAEEAKEKLCRVFDALFEQQGLALLNAIDSHAFDSIISEDKSARVPALILQSAFNKIYTQRSEAFINLVPIPLSRAVNRNEVEMSFREAAERGEIGEGFLYVTDAIDSGSTFNKMIKSFSSVLEIVEANKPKRFAFVSLGGNFDSVTKRKIEEAFSPYGEIVLVAAVGRGPESIANPSQSWTTLIIGLEEESAHSSQAWREAKGKAIVDEVSDHIVELYSKLKKVGT